MFLFLIMQTKTEKVDSKASDQKTVRWTVSRESADEPMAVHAPQ